MCGRYAFGPSQALQERIERTNLAIDEVRSGRQSTISFNVSPGRWGPVYRQESTTDGDNSSPNRRVVDWMKWGLIPSFAKESRIGSTFNCRDDSLTQTKSLWNGVKQYNRCIVLASGYYEWFKKPNSNARVPHFVKRKDGKLLCMAGLWDVNTKITDNEEELFTYTVITTDAHSKIAWLHDRMPVILEPEQVDDWLRLGDKWNEHPNQFLKLLKPFDATKLEVYQVSPDVGKLTNDYEGLTLPLKDAKGTISSFFNGPKKRSSPEKESKDDSPSEQNKKVKTEPESSSQTGSGSPTKKTKSLESPKARKQSSVSEKKTPKNNKSITSFFTKSK